MIRHLTAATLHRACQIRHQENLLWTSGLGLKETRLDFFSEQVFADETAQVRDEAAKFVANPGDGVAVCFQPGKQGASQGSGFWSCVFAKAIDLSKEQGVRSGLVQPRFREIEREQANLVVWGQIAFGVQSGLLLGVNSEGA